MTLFTEKVRQRLDEIGRQVKELFPDVDGNVQIHVGRNHKEPKVNVNLADVTKGKK